MRSASRRANFPISVMGVLAGWESGPVRSRRVPRDSGYTRQRCRAESRSTAGAARRWHRGPADARTTATPDPEPMGGYGGSKPGRARRSRSPDHDPRSRRDATSLWMVMERSGAPEGRGRVSRRCLDSLGIGASRPVARHPRFEPQPVDRSDTDGPARVACPYRPRSGAIRVEEPSPNGRPSTGSSGLSAARLKIVHRRRLFTQPCALPG